MLPVIATIFPSKSFFCLLIFACSKDQYSISKISFLDIVLYLEVSSTEDITRALVSAKSPAILAALELVPILNIPIFCTKTILGDVSNIVLLPFTFFWFFLK